MSHVMTMNEYRLTSSYLVTKMADDNDAMLAVASTIIAAAAVRRSSPTQAIELDARLDVTQAAVSYLCSFTNRH